MEDGSRQSFFSVLGLEEQTFDRKFCSPFIDSISVSSKDCAIIERWIGFCEHSKILGTALIQLRPVSIKRLDAFARWGPIIGNSSRCILVQGAVRHFRDRIDVSNMQRIWPSSELFDRGLQLFSMDKKLIKIKHLIQARLGISGFSYGQLFAEAILGDGGHAEFKAGLQLVRRGASCPEGVRAMKFKSCLSLLPAPADASSSSARHRRAVARLVFLARHQVATDMAGKTAGTSTEDLLVRELLRAGLQRRDFLTEDQLRDTQQQTYGSNFLPTPDVLFRRPVVISAGMRPVRWIDAKDVVIMPGCTMHVRIRKFREQLEKYTRFYGEGAVVWRHGWAASLCAPESVSFLRFRDAEPIQEDDDVERPLKKRRKGLLNR